MRGAGDRRATEGFGIRGWRVSVTNGRGVIGK